MSPHEEPLAIGDMNATPLAAVLNTPALSTKSEQGVPVAAPQYNPRVDIEPEEMQTAAAVDMMTFQPQQQPQHQFQQQVSYAPPPQQPLAHAPVVTHAPAATTTSAASTSAWANPMLLTALVAFAALLAAPKLGASVPALVNAATGRLNVAGLALVAVLIGVVSRIAVDVAASTRK